MSALPKRRRAADVAHGALYVAVQRAMVTEARLMESVWKKLATEEASGAASVLVAVVRCAYVSPFSHTLGCTVSDAAKCGATCVRRASPSAAHLTEHQASETVETGVQHRAALGDRPTQRAVRGAGVGVWVWNAVEHSKAGVIRLRRLARAMHLRSRIGIEGQLGEASDATACDSDSDTTKSTTTMRRCVCRHTQQRQVELG
jgi:hypothetical protein